MKMRIREEIAGVSGVFCIAWWEICAKR